ncbi:TPA: hypothetical protein MIH43_25730 [Klebsiella pneumoniae]|nr:hypothetical protein [Klebsiella pneumoniae]
MPLYKFLEEQHLESFFDKGCLRLGTIYDFKDILTHSLGRGDSKEGRRQINRDVTENLYLNSSSNENVISDSLEVTGNGSVNITNSTFYVIRNSPNAFIFCSSNAYSNELFKKWNEHHNEINACYEISDPNGFLREISNAIRNSANFITCKDIVYSTNPIPYNHHSSSVLPMFVKEITQYEWQLENRAVWYPKEPSPQLKPWIIFAPEARKYCRPFSKLVGNTVSFF